MGRDPGAFFSAEVQRRLHAAVGDRGQPALANGDVLLGGDGVQPLVDQRDQRRPGLARDHRLLVLAESGGACHPEIGDAQGLHQVIGDQQVADIGVGGTGRHGQQRVLGAVVDGQVDGRLSAFQQALHDIAALDGNGSASQVVERVNVARIRAGEDGPGGGQVVLAHGQRGQALVGAFGGREQIIVTMCTGNVLEAFDPGVRGGHEAEIDVEQLADDAQIVDRHALGLGPVDLPGRVLANAHAHAVLLPKPGTLIRAERDVRGLRVAPLAQDRHHLDRLDGRERLVDDAEQRGVGLADGVAQVDPAAGHRKRQVQIRQHVLGSDPDQIGAGDGRIHLGVLHGHRQV